MLMTNKLIWTEEELQQGGDAWLGWRKGDGESGTEMTLGGSEIACLMYMSPFGTLHDLFREKMGWEKKEFSEASMATMDRGTRLEPVARDFYAKQEGVAVRQLCAIHPTLPWARTSLDGITEDNRVILEIKSPKSWENHVKQTKNGRVPDYRYPQMQWQLAVMREHFENVERVDYVSYWEIDVDVTCDGSIPRQDMQIIPVYPDDAFIAELLRRGEIFISYLRAGVAPPPTLFIENLPLTATYPTPRKAKGGSATPAFF
jgi:putative phage-type endonuclease